MGIENRIKKLERERRRGEPQHILLEVDTPEGKKYMDVDSFIASGLDFLADAHIVRGNDLDDICKLLDYMAPGSVIKWDEYFEPLREKLLAIEDTKPFD